MKRPRSSSNHLPLKFFRASDFRKLEVNDIGNRRRFPSFWAFQSGGGGGDHRGVAGRTLWQPKLRHAHVMPFQKKVDMEEEGETWGDIRLERGEGGASSWCHVIHTLATKSLFLPSRETRTLSSAFLALK